MDWIDKANQIRILTLALLVAALSAIPAHAQVRGMGGIAPGSRPGNPGGSGRRGGFLRGQRGGFFPGSAFLPYGCSDYGFDQDYDQDTPDDPEPRDVAPVQVFVEPPAQPVVPPPPPADALLLEYQDGQYVRIPTGGHLPDPPKLTPASSSPARGARPGMASQKEADPPAPVLPRAVLLFRDGHKEEIGKYVIHNDVIYASEDYWNTGSWTKIIPIVQLDVPATLKLNQKRGAKFSLPSGPGEITVRF